ncbi:hypothetical protein [Anabaena azotica]|uniref:Uncharacterized protein n=1 Tax=Anabaena azotica FACHB-119 TaxID=947527 RepID=A0ABR8D9S0_9NOST|nr:hypothetical protein [Anabaena azotica]MBD2503060.1 hypothetical protein [Anabaena azotica FACHB-119]
MDSHNKQQPQTEIGNELVDGVKNIDANIVSRNNVSKLSVCIPTLAVAIASTLTLVSNCALAQVVQENTLSNHSGITTQNHISLEGNNRTGEKLSYGSGVVSLPQGITGEFNNTVDAKNILSRAIGNFVNTSVDNSLGNHNTSSGDLREQANHQLNGKYPIKVAGCLPTPQGLVCD